MTNSLRIGRLGVKKGFREYSYGFCSSRNADILLLHISVVEHRISLPEMTALERAVKECVWEVRKHDDIVVFARSSLGV